MNKSKRAELLKCWSERVRKTRKQFFFEWLLDGSGKKSPYDMGNRFFQDAQYLWQYLYYLLKHFKHYGSVIKEQYQVPLLRQFYQISYLVFKLRQHPKIYLKYHLFKPDVWKYSNRFTYSHYSIQQIVAKQLYPDELDILLNKLNFHAFCKTHSILSPDILGYSYDGTLLSEKGDFELPDKDIFVKEIAGQMGIGAKKFIYRDGMYRDVSGNQYTKELVARIISDYAKRKSAVIIQPVIHNHDSWLPFTSGALATCRAVTAKQPGTTRVELLSSSMRLPVGNTDVDNYSRGGMVSAVGIESGILNKAYCSVPVDGIFESDFHPDTGQKITGSKLPGWHEMREFILKLHENLESPFIGWDVSLTEEGVMVLEGSLYWNPGASIEVAHHQPLSKSKYPEYFESWIGEKVDNLNQRKHADY